MLKLPSPLHERACETTTAFLSKRDEVDAILVVRSCARGTAVPASDLDMAYLVRPDVDDSAQKSLWQDWLDFRQTDDAILALCASNQFAAMHLETFDGRFMPSVWDDNGGPDSFEYLIGNFMAHAVPTVEPGPRYKELQTQWLPYYSDELRSQRLLMSTKASVADLDCVPFYLDRDQPFQAFDRLYKAFKEYMQALMIHERTYPLGYDRWIREQVIGLLNRPDLYEQLPGLLAVDSLTDGSMLTNVAAIRQLVADLRD